MKSLNEYLNPINEVFNGKNINIKDSNIYCLCVTDKGGAFYDEDLKGFVGIYSLNSLISIQFSDNFVLSDVFKINDEQKFESKLKSLKIGETIMGTDTYLNAMIIRIS